MHSMLRRTGSWTGVPALALTVGIVLAFGIGGCSGSSEAQADKRPTKQQILAALAAAASDTTGGDSLRVKVEQPPKLIGGMEALADDVEYPESARQNRIEGTVLVNFVVNKDGEPEELTIARGVNRALNQAAQEAVRQQTFRPGMRGDKPVRVSMVLPVTFRLD